MAEKHPFFGLKRKSKYHGVSWAKWDAKWQATIVVDGKLRHLGHFVNEDDAARARDAAWIVSGKDPLKLNFPEGNNHIMPETKEGFSEGVGMTEREAPEPAHVWLHCSLGYWFSVADECKEDGDIEYVPKAQLDAAVEQAVAKTWKKAIAVVKDQLRTKNRGFLLRDAGVIDALEAAKEK